MKINIEVEKRKNDELFLHMELGKGKLPDGRECRLIQINSGVYMQVTNKDKNSWEGYFISWDSLSQAFYQAIQEFILQTKK